MPAESWHHVGSHTGLAMSNSEKSTFDKDHPDSQKNPWPFLIFWGVICWFLGNLLWDFFWGLFPSTLWVIHDSYATLYYARIQMDPLVTTNHSRHDSDVTIHMFEKRTKPQPQNHENLQLWLYIYAQKQTKYAFFVISMCFVSKLKTKLNLQDSSHFKSPCWHP